MIFELEKTNIYKAVKISRIIPLEIIKGLSWLFFILAVFLFLISAKPGFLGLSSEQIIGLFIIFLLATIKAGPWLAFFGALSSNFLLKSSLADQLAVSSENIEKINLAEYLDFRLASAIVRALKFCQSEKISLIVLAVIFYLWDDSRVKLIFEQLDLDKRLLKQKLNSKVSSSKKEIARNIYSQDFLEIIKRAGVLAGTNFHRQIEMRDFLAASAEREQGFREVLIEADMTSEDINRAAAWEDFVEHDLRKRKQFWRLENLRRIRGIGKRWAAGYTVNLDRYSLEITDIIKKQSLSIQLISHQKEIYAIERILARSGANNILLVGRPGVGRSSIAHAFAKKISEGRSFSNLNDKRILELDVQEALAGLVSQGEMLERLNVIFSEAVKAGNVILIIDEIHNFLGMGKGPGAIDIGSVILPYLSSVDFQLIGITSYEGWHKCIENNPSIKNLFVKVEVQEPNILQTILILEDMLPGLEKRYKLSVSYRILRDVVKLTDHYIQDVPFPEKAIDILTEVLVYTKTKNEKKVLPDYVNKIISERVEVPVGAIKEEEREKLLALEERIHQRVIDQKEAVKLISEAMRRARAGVKEGKRPIGSFLFLGPTGVGKTETSKALAEAYFGSEDRMIRFDMSEYQEIDSLNRLIGLPEKEEPGLLPKAISDNPFSLVLLDEIEKAHPNILNLFLQVLDEGWLTDAFGKKVSFADSIIIGTSNAGAEIIRQRVKEGKDLASFKDELIDYLLKQGVFRAEFLNRFDAVVVFRPLSHEDLVKIAILMMNNLSKRLYEGMGIRLVVNPDLVEKVAKLGYQPEFGARPMRRVIQDKIESKIAKEILEKNLKRGAFIEVKADEIK
jgi:ATP-dependent Clp protease ATP-binding subunit ClpC